MNFNCGDVIAEKKGGDLYLVLFSDNLRVTCEIDSFNRISFLKNIMTKIEAGDTVNRKGEKRPLKVNHVYDGELICEWIEFGAVHVDLINYNDLELDES